MRWSAPIGRFARCGNRSCRTARRRFIVRSGRSGQAATCLFLDFGRLDALIDAQELRTHELLLKYKKTILAAVAEVDDAIKGYRAARQKAKGCGTRLQSSSSLELTTIDPSNIGKIEPVLKSFGCEPNSRVIVAAGPSSVVHRGSLIEAITHTVPERVLTVRLDGSAEYQTSDGDERLVPAGSFVLFEDVDGKGHKSLHSPEEQTVLWISLPQGLENP